MRIGVVSDTHLPRFGRSLPEPLVRGFRDAGVERLIHCGDWTEPFVVDLLEAIAPVDGVAGNNDPPEIASRFGYAPVIEFEHVRIGITHGHIGPTHITTPERAVLTFAPQPDVAVICFGHSHIPSVGRGPNGTLLLNPGSPTDKRRQRRYSWALMTVGNGRVEAELQFFDR
ncbi:MAG TPA: metallophosphoesterase [Candidatus Limnocylindrales bacterium]|nr:metallophosphoesterase [Candidatus Limnocylindrales bacterium]